MASASSTATGAVSPRPSSLYDDINEAGAPGTASRWKKEQSESVTAILLPLVMKRFKRMDERGAVFAIEGMLACFAEAGLRLFPNWPVCHECHEAPAERLEEYVDRLPQMRERTARMIAAARDNSLYHDAHPVKERRASEEDFYEE